MAENRTAASGDYALNQAHPFCYSPNVLFTHIHDLSHTVVMNTLPDLSRYLDDGNLPIDNNWIENQMRPWALGRKNWLFAGSLRSGQRAANIMTLIQSAKLNGLDPYAYLSDVLKRLPTHKVPQIEELLPHRWKPEPR